MTPRPIAAPLALLLAGTLALSPTGCRQAGPEARPSRAPTEEAVPAAGGTADLGLTLSLLVPLVTGAANKGIESSGLFEALGMNTSNKRLDEIIRRLDEVEQQLTVLSGQVKDLEKLVETVPARTLIAEQEAHFQTCYDRLKDMALASSQDPEVLAQYDAALLARAYQVVGLPAPNGMTFSDDYCAILEPLNQVQRAILPEDPQATSPLTALAQLARSKGRGFEDVVTYFAWVVGIEQHAMTLVAQAHHRLGHDALLAGRTAALRDSLRRQEVALLRAAEAYVVYQASGDFELGYYDRLEARAALAMADQVVAAMEGTPRYATDGWVAEGAPDLAPIPSTLTEGDEVVALEDRLEAGADAGYGATHWYAAPRHYFVQPLGRNAGIAVGSSDQLKIARFRTSRLKAADPTVKLQGWPDIPNPWALPVTIVERANAVTLGDDSELPASPADPAVLHGDRILLAHSAGLASSASRFKLLHPGNDPAVAVLAVDEPDWGLQDVPVGAAEDALGTSFFASAPAGAELTLVPYGPAEPERFALQWGERWLGVEPSTREHAWDPEPYARVVAGAEPFYFDLVRDGDAYRMSYLDAEDGVRRYLYVNAQSTSAMAWRVATLGALTGIWTPWQYWFGLSDPQQTGCAFLPDLVRDGRPVNLLLEIHGAGYPASYDLNMTLGFSGDPGACRTARGSCSFVSEDGKDIPWITWDTSDGDWFTRGYPADGIQPTCQIPGFLCNGAKIHHKILSNQLQRIRCTSLRDSPCNACVTVTSLTMTVQSY